MNDYQVKNILNIKVVEDFIPENRWNRPATFRGHSLFGYRRIPLHIVMHMFWTTSWDAVAGNNYFKTERAANRPAAYNITVDSKIAIIGVPLDEPTFHAGDGVVRGGGNRDGLGVGIIDSAIVHSTGSGTAAHGPNHPAFQEYLKSEDYAARVCAYLITTGKVRNPYPKCMTTHRDWSGKNCPSHMHNRPNGWSDFVALVGDYIALVEGGNFPEQEEPPVQNRIRVIVGSNTDYEASKLILTRARQTWPTFSPEIVLNEVNDKLYFRVVLAELDRQDHAATLISKARSEDFTAWAVTSWEDMPFDIPEEPDDLPENDYVEGYDPDIDRDLIEEKPEEYEIPSGLLKILKMLWELLNQIFK